MNAADFAKNFLFGYGYGNHGTVDDLKSFVDGGAIVMDIRANPDAGRPGFTRADLRAAIRHTDPERRQPSYIHNPFLGNKNYRTEDRHKGVALSNVSAGMAFLRVQLIYRPVVLLCGCADPAGCHRTHVAAEAVRRKFVPKVYELAPGDRLPRLAWRCYPFAPAWDYAPTPQSCNPEEEEG